MHDATKVLMGATHSSAKEVSIYDSDPATYIAGLAVRQSTVAGALSVASGSGAWVGVSLGKSLSDSKKTAVVRDGELIPLALTLLKARAQIVITDYAALISGTDDAITIDGVAFTAQTGAVTPGAATFRANADNATTAISLGEQINAHVATAAKMAAFWDSGTIYLVAKTPGAAANALTLTYTDNDSNIGATVSGALFTGGSDDPADIDYATIGTKVYIHLTTGKGEYNNAITSVISDAVYMSGPLTGIAEDGTEVACALVSMPGGL